MIPRLNHTHSFKVTAYSPFAQGKAIRGKGVLQEEVVLKHKNYLPSLTYLCSDHSGGRKISPHTQPGHITMASAM